MCAAYMNKLNVSCTWKTANGRSIKDTVTFGNASDGNSETDVNELVSFETCVQLTNPCSSASRPMLNFNFTSDYHIRAIKVICEARIIELYGRGGEYITTAHSDFVDDFEGMEVYSTLLKLNIPSFECSLKFNKLKNPDNFWLYGVGIYMDSCQGVDCSDSEVNLKSITDRLQMSGCNLSDNAEQCLKLLREFKTGAFGERKHLNISNLHEDITRKSGIEDAPRMMCDLLLGMSPALPNLRGLKTFEPHTVSPMPSIECELPAATRGSVGSLNTLLVEDSTVSDIRTFLAEQFQKLESNLMAKVDARLNKMEEKLDMLMVVMQTNAISLGSNEEKDLGKEADQEP